MRDRGSALSKAAAYQFSSVHLGFLILYDNTKHIVASDVTRYDEQFKGDLWGLFYVFLFSFLLTVFTV